MADTYIVTNSPNRILRVAVEGEWIELQLITIREEAKITRLRLTEQELKWLVEH